MAAASTSTSQGFDLGRIITPIANAAGQVGTVYLQGQTAKSLAKYGGQAAPSGSTVAILAGIVVVGFLGFILLRRK